MRLFVALDLPPDAIDAVTEVQARLTVGRPSDPDTIHLTLAFLGEVSEALTEAIHDALSAMVLPAVPLGLRGIAPFAEGRVIAAGVDPNPPLLALQADVMRALRRAGVELPRRRFRPHVTLARLRRAPEGHDLRRLTDDLADHAGFRHGPSEAVTMTLFRSLLMPDGAIHDPLATYPLRPRP